MARMCVVSSPQAQFQPAASEHGRMYAEGSHYQWCRRWHAVMLMAAVMWRVSLQMHGPCWWALTASWEHVQLALTRQCGAQLGCCAAGLASARQQAQQSIVCTECAARHVANRVEALAQFELS